MILHTYMCIHMYVYIYIYINVIAVRRGRPVGQQGTHGLPLLLLGDAQPAARVVWNT